MVQQQDILNPEDFGILDIHGEDVYRLFFEDSKITSNPSIQRVAASDLFDAAANYYQVSLDTSHMYSFFIAGSPEPIETVIYGPDHLPLILNDENNDGSSGNTYDTIENVVIDQGGTYIIAPNWVSNSGTVTVYQFALSIDLTGEADTFDVVLDGRSVDGLAGIDIGVVSDTFGGYTIESQSGAHKIAKTDGGDALLSNIERIYFSDAKIALDIDDANSAGGVYRLYQAAFNRDPDKQGLGYWINEADNGMSAVAMAENFVWSAEFQNLYSVETKDQFLSGFDIEAVVSQIYTNVLGREADQGGLDFYSGEIMSNQRTVGQVLAEISDSSENRLNIIAEIENGFEYIL